MLTCKEGSRILLSTSIFSALRIAKWCAMARFYPNRAIGSIQGSAEASVGWPSHKRDFHPYALDFASL